MSSSLATPLARFFANMNAAVPIAAPSAAVANPTAVPTTHEDVPRPKRIACVVCRKRKLRCDGTKPSCGTCSRLGHDCAYDEARRKSGPKRGYVKALEARLAQVETLLKDHNTSPEVLQTQNQDQINHYSGSPMFPEHNPSLYIPNKDGINAAMHFCRDSFSSDAASNPHIRDLFSTDSPMLETTMPMPANPPMEEDVPLTWDMMSMGIEEALPAPDLIDALHKLYFERIHPCAPIMHKARYMTSLDLAPSMRPPIALRYSMWCMASSVSDEYTSMQTHFYRRARKYLEEAELRGHGEGIVSLSIAQAWILIATYEFKLMYFPRAWMSTGRAIRLSQMTGLHRLDGNGLDVKQCLPAPKDWTEREERRRTFWMAFCLDRYASIGTGWPMTIEEKDIMSNLPVSEEAFDQGRPARALSLKEAITSEGAKYLSSFGGICVMGCLFGRNLIHLHRPEEDDNEDDMNGAFWKRHRHMDNILLNIALSLPPQFRLPGGIDNPNIIFTNMNIHTSTICLHQAAIFKAEKYRMAPSLIAESKIRCITAAAEIASIMRMVCHRDLSRMNPFMPFCLYVAARVFVQYLKARPGDEQVHASLQFLITAMGHLKKKSPFTESFLAQLDVDLTGSLDSPCENSKFPYSPKKGQTEIHSEGCKGDFTAKFAGARNHNLPAVAEHGKSAGFTFLSNDCAFGFTLTSAPALSPHNSQHSQNSTQSPASMDLSDNSQNMTPSSHVTTPNQNGSVDELSPLNFVDLSNEQYQIPPPPRDMNWEALDFENSSFENINMAGEAFSEFFAESIA